MAETFIFIGGWDTSIFPLKEPVSIITVYRIIYSVKKKKHSGTHTTGGSHHKTEHMSKRPAVYELTQATSKKRKTGTTHHTCSHCDYKSSNSGHFRNHWRTHSGEKPFECTTCDYKCTTKAALTIHERRHSGEKPFECKTCNKAFCQSGNLRNHLRTHSGEKPFECKTCGKAFRLSHHLTTHMMRHSGEKPFECKTCDYKCTTSSDLKTHEITHSGEKPFECTTCGKAFSLSHHLKTHERTHSGEKPFECKTCSKAFCRSGDLTTHERTHSGEKPYQCNQPNCVYRAAQKSTLMSHLKSRHDIGKLPCAFCVNEVAILESYKDNHGNHKICRTCHKRVTGRTTRVEKLTMDYLATHYGMTPASQDQKVNGVLCMNYRPDSAYESPFVTKFLEVDEHQHSNKTSYECDERRMGDLAAEIPGVPCVFIRWNPDKYVYHRQGATVDGKVVDYALTKRKCQSLHTRMEYLVAHLRKVDAVFAEWDGEDIRNLPEWVRPGRANLVVHYIYYDRDNETCARSEDVNVQFYQPI